MASSIFATRRNPTGGAGGSQPTKDRTRAIRSVSLWANDLRVTPRGRTVTTGGDAEAHGPQPPPTQEDQSCRWGMARHGCLLIMCWLLAPRYLAVEALGSIFAVELLKLSSTWKRLSQGCHHGHAGRFSEITGVVA
jgi:hypothetical protein